MFVTIPGSHELLELPDFGVDPEWDNPGNGDAILDRIIAAAERSEDRIE